MKIVRFFVVGFLSTTLIFCASASKIAKDSERQTLLNGANNFYQFTIAKNGEGIYELLSPWMKEGINRQEYIGEVDLLFHQINFSNYTGSSIVLIQNKIAVTQAHLEVSYNDGSGSIIDKNYCERIIWLRFPDGWYAQEPGRTCDYLPDKQRIEFLTKNLPSR